MFLVVLIVVHQNLNLNFIVMNISTLTSTRYCIPPEVFVIAGSNGQLPVKTVNCQCKLTIASPSCQLGVQTERSSSN